MAYPITFGRGYTTGLNLGTQRVFSPINAGDTGSITVTSGTAYALYLGVAPKTVASVLGQFYQHGASAVAGAGGASVNWCELAIATGSPGSMAASADLTIRGYTSINAQAVAASTEWRSATISGLSIPAGSDMWIVVAGAYETTQVSFRIPLSFVNARGYARTRAACQPSANIGSALAFTATVTTGTTVPFMSAQVL